MTVKSSTATAPVAALNSASTQTDRWTCHVYPSPMWPDGVIERPISILFDCDDIPFDVPAALDLTADEARALAAALMRAVAAREVV